MIHTILIVLDCILFVALVTLISERIRRTEDMIAAMNVVYEEELKWLKTSIKNLANTQLEIRMEKDQKTEKNVKTKKK